MAAKGEAWAVGAGPSSSERESVMPLDMNRPLFQRSKMDH